MRHYLMTTDEHFTKAVNGATQHLHAWGRTESQPQVSAQRKTPGLPGYAAQCDATRSERVAATGFEHIAKTSGKTAKLESRDAKCDARLSDDQNLAVVVDAWPNLTAIDRRAILKIVAHAKTLEATLNR